MKNELRFPTILGLIAAVGGLIAGLTIMQSRMKNVLEASADTIPDKVAVTNVSDTGFSVSWITPQSTTGYIMYGETQQDLNNTVSDERDQISGSVTPYMAHSVSIQGLKPETTYRFKVGSNKNTYGLSDIPYQVTTGPILNNKPAADVAYGQVIMSSGEPAEGLLIYLQINGGVKQSTITKLNGSWAIPLSTIRTTGGREYLSYDKKSAVLEIEVDGGPLGTSTVRVTADQDSPVREIVLGENFDLTQSTDSGKVTTEDVTESKLGQMIKNDLVLLSPMTGEKVNTAKPEIIGTAPEGAEIQIEINSSSKITGSAVAGTDGNFSFSVPASLEPGEHTVTISTVINGVVKRVTRSFVVYAVGESFEPAFSATPSATPVPTVRAVSSPAPTVRPTATPTAKPSPTLTPVPTPTAKPSPTVISNLSPAPTVRPTATPTAKPSPTLTPVPTPKPSPTPPVTLENSGSSEYSAWLTILGVLLVTAGAVWYKKAV